ncbi:site-specific integrase [uncultured Arcticibacterium sp.]|uniref:site-specific integrase n=1 Tax=uncultured Arcticibacterium sp. TaxID=2173042 RepID=UPI0030F86B65
MASIKVVLFASKILRNGEHPIMLRITKDRKTRYSSLGHSCHANLWDKVKCLPKRKHPQFRELSILIEHKKSEATKKLYALETEDEHKSLEEIQKHITNKKQSTTILVYIDSIKKDLEDAGRIGNSKVYKDLKRVLTIFLKKKDISLTSITPSFLKKLEQHFRVLGWKPNTMSVYFRTLRSTINKAIVDGYLNKDKNPFTNYSISHLKNETDKRAISQTEVKKLEALEITHPKEKLAQDFFMFSYYCSGMNFMDFAKIEVSQVYTIEGKSFLSYTRSKTKKLLNVQLVPQALDIFQRYNEYKESNDYIFPVLDKARHIEPKSIANRIQKVGTQINKDLKVLAERAGITTSLTTYTARHSFATTLKRLGQSTAVISNMMGHKTEAITQVYLDSFENEVLYEASLKL